MTSTNAEYEIYNPMTDDEMVEKQKYNGNESEKDNKKKKKNHENQEMVEKLK